MQERSPLTQQPCAVTAGQDVFASQKAQRCQCARGTGGNGTGAGQGGASRESDKWHEARIGPIAGGIQWLRGRGRSDISAQGR